MWIILGHVVIRAIMADFIETYSRRLVDPKECSTLEENIISATYCLKKTLPAFPRLLNGTIKELAFSVKDDLKSIQAKHVTRLSLLLNLSWLEMPRGTPRTPLPEVPAIF